MIPHQDISPANTEFLILSFEGPDRYSLAGGLGVRVTHLAETLAHMGFVTHLLFVGDPHQPGQEVRCNGKLSLYRWCQWISQYHPKGVYDGENGKLHDFNRSVPAFVSRQIVGPAVAKGKLAVVLGEEWHTSEAMCLTSDVLYAMGIRDQVIMLWNANNTFSFDRIDWARLNYTTTITTVSRYMRQIMRSMRLNPLVIPNGIPESLFSELNDVPAVELRGMLRRDVVLSKVARWDPDKHWAMALETVAGLKASGASSVLLARGGIEPYGWEVAQKARSLGLTVKDVYTTGDTIEDYFEAIGAHADADILNIRFYCPQEFLRIVYRASDAVLANSGHEPFGLVGLEAMAAGGIAFTGGTGEDYVVPFHNCMPLETSDPREAETYLLYLKRHPAAARCIREAARETARQFTWEHVVGVLVRKLEYQGRLQGILVESGGTCASEPGLLEADVILPGQPGNSLIGTA